jgi:RNA recognition motif-containing protein
MSSDYRPRGGGSPGGGGRRRRGGRNRGGRPHGEHRSHSNGTTPHAPAKKESPIAKLFGWLTGKKKKTESSRPAPIRTSSPRPDFRSPAPRDDRPRREDRPPRPEPTPQEITTAKLYVGNLSYDAAESDLFDLFSKVGEVKNVEVAKDRHSGRSKGFGFVEMAALETAKEAAAKYNRTDFLGRQIVVSGAKLEKRSAPAPRENEGDDSPSESSI